MSTFDFRPPPNGPFTFQPTLDGQGYTAIVTWSLFGRRFYLNLYAQDGTLVVAKAVVGSTTGRVIQSLSWADEQAVAETREAHGIGAGQTADLVVSGCVPAAYNGRVRALALDATRLQYPLMADPGAASVLGTVGYEVNLVGAYFSTSSLIYREPDRQFVVSP